MSIPGAANPLLLRTAAAGGYNVERSLRFNSSDSAFCSRTPASAGNRKTWTWAGWVKRSAFGTYQYLFSAGASESTDQSAIRFNTDETIDFFYFTGSFQWRLNTTQVFRDPSSWYHIVAVCDTDNATANNRARLYVNGAEITVFATRTNPASGSTSVLNNNVEHRIGVPSFSTSTYQFSGYLADIYFIDGQALDPTSFTEVSATTGQLIPKQYTGSFGTNGFWLKFSDNSAATATTLGKDYSGNSNNWTPNNFAVERTQPNYISAISFENCSLGGGSIANGFDTSTSTFFNTTNATNSTIVFAPTIPITINSSLVFYGALGGNQGWSVKIGSTTLASGQNEPGSPYTIPNAVGKTISSSDPLRLISNGSGEGVYFSALVVDGLLLVNAAGAGNDSLVDTPTNYGTDDGLGGSVRGNYCTWNPLNIAGGALANGNLDLTNTGGGRKVGTVAVSSGKWYWEVTVTSAGDAMIGAMSTSNPVSTASANYLGGAANEYGYYQSANKYTNGSASSYGATFGNGDVIGVALDLDAGTLVYYKNGVSQGTAFTSISGTYAPAASAGGSNGASMTANFGQRPFAYAAPNGFKALCTTNLPDPVVAQGSSAFDVKLYTGNGSTQTITTGFGPDLVWVKQRDTTNTASHVLVDSVRGNNLVLRTNGTDQENSPGIDPSLYDGVTNLSSTGFDAVKGSSSVYNGSNGSGKSYVAWCWDAGSSTVTNTQGSITSSVRANASAGFSIVSYTGNGTSGATVGHGLGVAPSLIIVKNRDQTVSSWDTYHISANATPQNGLLRLNSTAAFITASDVWNNTAPTSTVFSLGNSGSCNENTVKYVAYCFAPVAGYSSGFSYTGNGSTDGSFVYLGFRPRLILLKCSSTTGNWTLVDTAREGYNVDNDPLYPNLSNAEGTTDLLDITSNGFKLRTTDASMNSSGATYIGFAWAENPFKYARAR